MLFCGERFKKFTILSLDSAVHYIIQHNPALKSVPGGGANHTLTAPTFEVGGGGMPPVLTSLFASH